MKKTLVVLGPEGSFSHLAALKLNWPWQFKFVKNFRELFSSVKKGAYGLCPIKNKILGDVSLGAIFKNRLKIIKKFRLKVSFVLAAKTKIPLKEIQMIYASKIAKRQCYQFLRRNLPTANFAATSVTTSSAFKKIVQLKGKRATQSAAIGSEFGAKMYGLKILARNIQDAKANWTEFGVIHC